MNLVVYTIQCIQFLTEIQVIPYFNKETIKDSFN